MRKIFHLFLNRVLLVPFIYWGFSMIANIFNWLFNIQAGRMLSKEEFSVLTVFLSLQYILSVPANSLAATISRFTAYYSERKEQDKHFYFLRQYWWLAWTVGLLSIGLFIVFQGNIRSFFGFDSSSPILLFALLLVPLFLLAYERGVLSGQLAFVWVGVLFMVEAGVKLGAISLSPSFFLSKATLAVLALPVSVFIAWLFSILVARSFHPLPVRADSKSQKKLEETYKFLGNSFFASLGAVLIYNLDILLVKHYFTAGQAGIYSTLSLMGKTLFFGAGSLISLIIPLTARAQGANSSGKKPFIILLSIIALAGLAVWSSYIFFPEFMVSKLLTEKGLVILPYLGQYSLGMLFLVLASCFITYSLAKKNYLPSRLTLIAALVEAVLIILHHQSLYDVVTIVSSTLFVLFLAVMAIEVFGISSGVIANNINSFLRLLTGEKREAAFNSNKTRVLIFNWRDIKHNRAGGSEVYIQEIAKRLVKEKYEVTLFTANDGKCASYEEVEGVRLMRRGGFITVYIWAFFYYLFRFRGKFDIIVDSENGIPFFSPLYTRVPVILLVHHVHQDIFFKSLIPPFSWIANFLETYLMPWIYRNSTIVAVSESTAETLRKEIGLTVTSIISNGVDTDSYTVSDKSETPLISYVGRLKKYKSIDVLLQAFKNVLTLVPRAQVLIAGDGDERVALEKLTKELGIGNEVLFLGKVTEKEKIELLGRSWIMVQPSYMEGWGITCLEANACGTPVIASRVLGLKDAVYEGISGYFFEYGDHVELARRLQELIYDEEKRNRLGLTSRQWSQRFSWDKQSSKFTLLIKSLLGVDLAKINNVRVSFYE